MNFALSDEQELLREAARGALSRHKTLEAAREALDGGERLDLWDTAREAGWPGLVIAEEQGGAGLGALDAMLVATECGRVLASVALLGHVPATALLDGADGELLGDLASGERRAAFVPARPPGDLDPEWTVDPERGLRRASAPRVDGDGKLSGSVHWVPDAPEADVLVVAAIDESDQPCAVLVEGAQVEEASLYDATRRLGHVTLDGASGTRLDAGEDDAALGLVPGPGADRGRVAGRGGSRAGDVGGLRQGAVHVRAPDRLLPGDQARPGRGAAAGREHALAALLRRLGAPGRAGRVRAGGQRRPRGRRARRWTTPRAS